MTELDKRVAASIEASPPRLGVKQPRLRFTDVISPLRLEELGYKPYEIEVVGRRSASICLYCKGGRMLCGKSRCPLIVKALAMIKHGPLIDSSRVDGATPPGVFVGRAGYPKVSVGPMVPPYHNGTEILDTPEMWLGRPIERIVDYRYALIRGKVRVNVVDARVGSRLLDTLQELAMAAQPVESEVEFTRRPRSTITLSAEVQPFGPSAPLKSFRASNIKADRRIEKAYYDRDLRAVEAVVDLYSKGVSVTRIQRAFSAGIFGVGGRRRLVPTRWSITAVDSSLSLALLEEVKRFDTIDEYRVYAYRNLDNIFVVILSPRMWQFEWIEAWFPGTVWNPSKATPAMMGDYEAFSGRTTYASVGGCYYSARLAIAEKLMRERRQASALALREIHPGYILPVGVWNVRESVRAALNSTPTCFDTFDSALMHAAGILSIPLARWVEASVTLKQAFFQRRISDYF